MKRILLTSLIIILIAVGVLLALPVNTTGLGAVASNPAQSYDEALSRIAALQARDEGLDLQDVCHTRFLDHGQPTERVIVFWHGYTNCPEQFGLLGEIFHEMGYTVLIPRLPHHGLRDRMTTAHSNMDATELVSLTTESLDIAQGLGEHVSSVGLSTGGVMSAWAAQHRSDLDQIMLIAPVFGVRVVPARLTSPVINAVAVLPNRYMWWNTEEKENRANPPQAYPRFSTHGLVEIMRIGQAAIHSARQQPIQTPVVLVVNSASDESVNNVLTNQLVALWRDDGLTRLETHEFPAELGIIHNMVDRKSDNPRLDIVYPVIIEMLHGEVPENLPELLTEAN